MSTASPCRDYGRLIAAHIRSDADEVFDSERELLEIGRRLGIPVQVSHIGSMAGFGQMEEFLRITDEYRLRGLDVSCDCYPYYAFSTTLGSTTYDDGWMGRYGCGYDAVELCEGEYKGQRCTEVMLKKRALIKSKRGANLFTWLLGIIIFTSGSLSCMVTGSISRPFNDALKVPHEKSAFIIHATSTPWCVLFPFSGWLAAMTGYLTSGGVAEGGAISVLLKSIPLNFYCILAVFGTLAVCLFNINIGPMRKAEERAEKTGELDEPGHGGALSDAADKVSDAKPRVINMVLPMCVLIVTILTTLTVTGNGNPTQGAGMQSLLWGCVLAVLTICILCVAQKLYTVEGVINEMFKGMGTMLPMAAVLLFGFTMGSLVKSLDTGNYLTAVFMGVLTPALLPMLSFLLCMLLSFATGTSMGTMAIMSVICLPMAINMGVNIELVAGAIFGGSIFGDHCSPISDTTIMSCATSGCDIIDHVKTQIPYAAICAGVSIVLYTVLGFVM